MNNFHSHIHETLMFGEGSAELRKGLPKVLGSYSLSLHCRMFEDLFSMLPGLEAIINPETKAAFEKSQTETRQLFARADIIVPTFEEMVAGSDNGQGERINLAKLARFYEQMDAEGQMPEIAITPQGLPLEVWQQIYDHMTPKCDHNKIVENAPGMPANNPFGKWGRKALSTFEDAMEIWSQINPSTVLRADGTPLPAYIDASGHHWTIRIIPGTKEPIESQVSYRQYKIDGVIHPTIAELVTIQGRRIQRGDKPLSTFFRTWAEGEFKESPDYAESTDFDAPVVGWCHVLDAVTISSESTRYIERNTGVRPPLG